MARDRILAYPRKYLKFVKKLPSHNTTFKKIKLDKIQLFGETMRSESNVI